MVPVIDASEEQGLSTRDLGHYGGAHEGEGSRRVPNRVPNSAYLTRANRSQLAVPEPSRAYSAPKNRNGKEGVSGSSPDEGSGNGPQSDGFVAGP